MSTAFFTPFTYNPAKGAYPDLETMRSFQGLDNYEWDESRKVGYFKNLNPEAKHIKRANIWEVAKFYLFKPKNAKPSHPLPFIHTDFHALYAPKPSVVWFGHSSLLIAYHNFKILVDPLFNDYASPYPFINRAFSTNIKWSKQDFDNIHLIIITHDHFDHLDYHTITMLKNKTTHFIVPLGVGSHLRYWGVEQNKITELNWWQSVELNKIIKSDSLNLHDLNTTLQNAYLTSVPSQHSSGRGIEWDRTLWSAYALEIGGVKIFLSGDGGYHTHFKDIGRYFGNIDLAVLENGQFNEAWSYSHSFTPQVIQEAHDLHAKMILPIHYGRFIAGSHAWNEPLKNLIRFCDEDSLAISVPRLGEIYEIGSPPLRTPWWEF